MHRKWAHFTIFRCRYLFVRVDISLKIQMLTRKICGARVKQLQHFSRDRSQLYAVIVGVGVDLQFSLLIRMSLSPSDLPFLVMFIFIATFPIAFSFRAFACS